MVFDTVLIDAGEVDLRGDLVSPDPTHGVVAFAHGSGSSRHSPRNQEVARVLQQAGLTTLLFDLLTEEEDRVDAVTAELRFDIPCWGGGWSPRSTGSDGTRARPGSPSASSVRAPAPPRR